MELKEALTGLASARAEYDRLVELASAPLKKQLVQFCKEQKIPGFLWTQYTPHFNDGDECIFGVNEPTLIVGDPAEVDRPYDDGTLETWSEWGKFDDEELEKLTAAGITKQSYEAFNALKARLCSSELEDVLRTAFGDHVVIKVTPERVTVDEYEHD